MHLVHLQSSSALTGKFSALAAVKALNANITVNFNLHELDSICDSIVIF